MRTLQVDLLCKSSCFQIIRQMFREWEIIMAHHYGYGAAYSDTGGGSGDGVETKGGGFGDDEVERRLAFVGDNAV